MKFKSKPIEIEATQFLPGIIVPGVYEEENTKRHYVITIHEQKAYLEYGDWVITEVGGLRHYPCKHDIFVARYEAMEPVKEEPVKEEPVKEEPKHHHTRK